MIRAIVVTTGFAMVAGAAGGCGGPTTSPDGDVRIRVLAAASLTEVFEEVGRRFSSQSPRVAVRFSFGASSSLAAQAVDGAPADVLATADARTMQRAVSGGAVARRPVGFAANRLVMAVPEGNPAGVAGLDDLGDEQLLVGLCAPAVPCGRVSRQALRQARVTPAPDTEEADVRALRTKLEAGELDVGLVYRTDVAGAGGRVDAIELPERIAASTTYQAAVLRTAAEPNAAERFVRWLVSPEARRVLVRAGFSVP